MAVTDEAISAIKAMIVTGEWQPGERLPPEKELSERLGLARNSLREAVKSLEMIGVLDVRRGDGTYVTSLEPHLLLEALAFVVDLHRDASVLEIFEVRRQLEPYAAELAATRMTDLQIAALERELARVDDATAMNDLVAHDLEFHRLIAQGGGNAYLASLLESMSGPTVRARVWRGITQHAATAMTLTEHRAIVSALHSRDAALTRAVVTTHVVGIENWLRRAL